jgi:hypothetical protein
VNKLFRLASSEALQLEKYPPSPEQMDVLRPSKHSNYCHIVRIIQMELQTCLSYSVLYCRATNSIPTKRPKGLKPAVVSAILQVVWPYRIPFHQSWKKFELGGRNSIPNCSRKFCLCHCTQTGLWIQRMDPRIKWSENESDHSSPSKAVVDNAPSSFTSPWRLCLHSPLPLRQPYLYWSNISQIVGLYTQALE